MDDDEFLTQVLEVLPEYLIPDVVVTSLRPVDGRPWLRAEATFERSWAPSGRPRSLAGSVFTPLDPQWRYDTVHDLPDDYARLVASTVHREVHKLTGRRRPVVHLTADHVDERWQWLLERLALSGSVSEIGKGQLLVTPSGDRPPFTVLATPDEWASIAEPLNHDADDPQDFSRLFDDTFLVFYEDRLAWSIRAELPPVRWGAEMQRESRDARLEGREPPYRWVPSSRR